MDQATKKAEEDLTFSLAVLAWKNGEQDEAISLLSSITEVECHECGKEGKASEMVYQGKDGKENTAPGSMFDYYVCNDCEAFYQRFRSVEDYEGEDGICCTTCGTLFHPRETFCTVCLKAL